MLSNIYKDPFRLFFPLAISCLLYASCLWMAHIFMQIGDFPLQEHANLMVGGFLYFSIQGFLTTAIPRFTSTKYMTRGELSVFVLFTLSTLLFYFIKEQNLFWFCISCNGLSLFIFSFKRFSHREQNPPFTFIFVGLGMLFGFLGGVFSFLANFRPEYFESRVINDPSNVIFAQTVKDRIIASIGIYKDPHVKLNHKANIWGVYTHPDYRGQGFGKTLLVEAINYAKEVMKARRVLLSVNSNSNAAIKLYLSQGFKKWGTEKEAMSCDNGFIDEDYMYLEL